MEVLKGSGNVGWEIELTVGGSGITAVTVIDAGQGFAAGDTITIPTSIIGGSSATATLTVVVSSNHAYWWNRNNPVANNTGRTASKTYSITSGVTLRPGGKE